MATVYLAIQENFQRQVALKIMAPELAKEQDFSERFLREAQIVSQLVHPHIVTVHDVGIENDHHYLSMEYIEGKDLKEMLPELSGEQIFRALREVAMALDYAGGKGYVHRDVKPENIMLNAQDGRAVLMDFGIARASRPDNSMTRTGIALGTPHYMSPEQARGQEVDGRSDLYSLGVLFYYMLLGKVPYDADSPVAVGIKHLTEPVPTLPAPLAGYQPLINRLMAKKPEQRFQTGKELCEALANVQVSPLERWHQRKEFHFQDEKHDTPVRMTTATGVVESDAIQEPGRADAKKQPAPAAKRSRSAGSRSAHRDSFAPEPRESLHIPKEDLAARSVAERQRNHWPLIVLLLLVVVAAGGFYLFPAEVHRYAQPAMALLDKWQGKESQSPQQNAQLSAQESVSQLAPVKEAAPLPGDSDLQASGTEAAVAESDLLGPLWQQVTAVEAGLATQPETRGELLDLYRQILAIDPVNEEALAGIENLKTSALASAQEGIESQQLEEVDAILADVLEWFPELADNENYLQLQQGLARSREIQTLLVKAKAYQQQDKLMKPAGDNAVETYRAVLALDEQNTEAQAGLQTIAARYREFARSQQQRQRYQQALTLVANGLSVAPQHGELLELKRQLQQQLKSQQRVEALIEEAKSFAAQGKLFAPSESAAQRYLAALAVDKQNTAADAGLSRLLADRYRSVESSIASRNFAQATEAVEEAMALLPRDERLMELLLDIESSKPTLERLVVSGSPIGAEQQSGRAQIIADRTLYIAFEYKNLAAPTTVFQAMLFDGSRSLQIAAVPVVVTGSVGRTQFRIDRLVEGFTEGGYHVDLLLAGERIYTQAFTLTK